MDDESYDPETGDYYVCSHFSAEVESIQSEKTNPTGGETYGTSKAGLSGTVPKPESRGYITAYNMQTGQIIWADELPHECFNEGSHGHKGRRRYLPGPMKAKSKPTTRPTVRNCGTLTIGAGPSMISVYEFGGKERVSIYGGGNDVEGTKHGDFLWQFSLNGTGPAQKECVECIAPGAAGKESLAAGRFELPLRAGPIAAARSRSK